MEKEPKKQENFNEKKDGEKFIENIKRKLKQSPSWINIETLTHCAKCKQRISDDSTEFFTTSSGMPFDSIQHAVESAIEGGHPLWCTCIFCGSKEELEKAYSQIPPAERDSYTLKETKEKLREQKILEYISKNKTS